MPTRAQMLGLGPNKKKYVPSNKRSRGLGDTIEKFTKATGIKKAVDTVAKATGKDCGCGKRRDTLNRIFPYDK
tara:strand:- start:9760 stop:9978 length:219 start_codon:yes stop_codon:yes gene_type:complete